MNGERTNCNYRLTLRCNHVRYKSPWHGILQSTMYSSGGAILLVPFVVPPPAGEGAVLIFAGVSASVATVDQYYFSKHPAADNMMDAGGSLVKSSIPAPEPAKSVYGLVVDIAYSTK